MAKVPVILIPEVHSLEGLAKVDSFIPLLQSVSSTLPSNKILNFTEGSKQAAVFQKLFSSASGGIPLTVVELEKTDTSEDAKRTRCIQFGLKILNILLDLEYRRKRMETEAHVSMLSKMMGASFGDSVKAGLASKPVKNPSVNVYVQSYAQHYNLVEYIDSQNDFFGYMGTAYLCCIEGRDTPQYNRMINGMLEQYRLAVKPICGSIFDVETMVGDLVAAGTLERRSSVIDRYRELLRERMDIHTIDMIHAALIAHPEIELVLLNCGEAHYNSLRSKIQASPQLMMEEAVNARIRSGTREFLGDQCSFEANRSEPSPFSIGKKVKLTGLTKVEYNGLIGKIIGPLSEGRIAVEFTFEGVVKQSRIKPENLESVPAGGKRNKKTRNKRMLRRKRNCSRRGTR